MSDLQIQVTKVMGQMGEQRWAQVHELKEDENSEGRVWVVLGLEVGVGREQVEVMAQGREMLGRLFNIYSGESARSVMERVSLMLEEVQREEGWEAQIVATWKEGVYLGTWGGGIWVKRGDKQGWAVNPQTVGMKVLSGRVDGREIIVVGNREMWKEVGEGLVSQITQKADIEEMGEMLAATIHVEEKGKSEAGLVIELQGTRKRETENRAEVAQEEPKVEGIEEAEEEKTVKAPNPLLAKIRNGLDKVVQSLPQKKHTVYLARDNKELMRKVTLGIGVGMGVILLVVVALGQVRKQQTQKANSEGEIKIQKIVADFKEAKALVNLNPVRTRELLAEVNQLMDGLDAKTQTDSRLAEVKSGIGEVLGVAAGIKNLGITEVLDLALLREDMKGSVIRLNEDKVMVLDTGGNRLVQVDVAKKSGTIWAGAGDLGQTQMMAVYPGKVVVLSDKGLVECLEQSQKCKAQVAKDSEWKSIVDMGMFAGNIYLMDAEAKQVWRYPVVESGYGAKQKWLTTDAAASLGTVTHVTIDGNIWMVESGKVTKYNRGVKDNFVMEELDKPLGEDVRIYAVGDVEDLYIWDRANKRVVVTKKTGEYEFQYRSEQLGEMQDMTLDLTNHKMYMVGGSKVWVADL